MSHPGSNLQDVMAGRIHPLRLRSLFSAACSPEQLERMQASQRFQSRILSLTAEHFGLPPWPSEEPLTEQQRWLMSASWPQVKHFMQACGVLLYSADLAREIRSDRVDQLQQICGVELYRMALQCRGQLTEFRKAGSYDDLQTRILSDGLACYRIWLDQLHPGQRQWLLMKQPEAMNSGTAATGEMEMLSGAVTVALDYLYQQGVPQ